MAVWLVRAGNHG